MIVLAIFLAIADPSQLPPGISCDDVRRLVAERGELGAIIWAKEHGLSFKQIWRIRKECRV